MPFDPSRRIFSKGAGVAGGRGSASRHPPCSRAAAGRADVGSRVLVQVFLRGGVDGLNLCACRMGTAATTGCGPPSVCAWPTACVTSTGSSACTRVWPPCAICTARGFRPCTPTIGNAQLSRSHFDAQDFMDSAAPGRQDRARRLARPRGAADPGRRRDAARGSGLAHAALRAGPSSRARAAGPHHLRGARGHGRSDLVCGGGPAAARRCTPAAPRPSTRAGAPSSARSTAFGRHPPCSLPGERSGVSGGTAGSGLRQAARLIRADIGTRAIYVNVPGSFDTHANQLAANNQEYPALAAALVAFRRDLGTRDRRRAAHGDDRSSGAPAAERLRRHRPRLRALRPVPGRERAEAACTVSGGALLGCPQRGTRPAVHARFPGRVPVAARWLGVDDPRAGGAAGYASRRSGVVRVMPRSCSPFRGGVGRSACSRSRRHRGPRRPRIALSTFGLQADREPHAWWRARLRFSAGQRPSSASSPTCPRNRSRRAGGERLREFRSPAGAAFRAVARARRLSPFVSLKAGVVSAAQGPVTVFGVSIAGRRRVRWRLRIRTGPAAEAGGGLDTSRRLGVGRCASCRPTHSG